METRVDGTDLIQSKLLIVLLRGLALVDIVQQLISCESASLLARLPITQPCSPEPILNPTYSKMRP